MSGPTPPESVEARLAERFSARDDPRLSRVVRLLRSLDSVDRDVYRAVATAAHAVARHTAAPKLGLRQLLQALVPDGGRPGRGRGSERAPSCPDGRGRDRGDVVPGQPADEAGARRRPHRSRLGVPRRDGSVCRRPPRSPPATPRRRRRSASRSARAVPELRWPLRAAAAVVAFSRVYTGVHYPGDVVVGATVGAGLGQLTSRVASRLRDRQSGASPPAPVRAAGSTTYAASSPTPSPRA